MRLKNIFILVFSVACLLISGITMAAFPEKDLTIIVPKLPGGGTDITTRALIQYAKHYTDHNIIAVNKPGAGGVTGMVQAASARPDGYTLVMTTVELDILPHLGRSPIDYKVFKYIVAPISEPAGLIVSKNSPFKSVQDFVNYAKAHPGELRVGNSGVASIWHLASLAIKKEFGINFIDVPYSGGSAQAVAALVGQHLDAITVGPGNASSQIKSGELKLLGIMSAKRSTLFPNVPTFKELGSNIVVRAWAALAAPSKVPQARFEILSDIFTKAMNNPDFAHLMNNQGIEVNRMGTREVNQMIRQDNGYYKKLLQKISL